MPPAFILSQDQTLHERKERPVDSGSTYSKLGSPRATRAGRSAHSIALSGFQGAGRLPERGGRRRCAISGAGLTLSRLKGIASPAGEFFRKKTDEGFFRAFRGLPPPFSRARPRAPTTHYPLHSPPYSLLSECPRTTLSILPPPPYSTEAHCIVTTHYPLHSSPYSLLNGSPLHSGHALLPPFFSLFPTQRKPTA